MSRKKSIKLPGPSGLPFIGNALQLDKKRPHHTLFNWIKDYGNLYKIKLFGEEIVVVSSEEGIREVILTKADDFAGRPENFRAMYFVDDLDIAFCSMDARVAHLKKLAMVGLRLAGEGVQQLEDITMDIIADLVNEIEKKDGKPFDPRDEFHNAVAAVTASLVS